jgi:competence protein ComEC
MQADRWPPSDASRGGGSGAGVSPAGWPVRRVPDPDPDGVAMVLAVAVGVLAGAAIHPSPPIVCLCGATTVAIAAVMLYRRSARPRARGAPVTGALGLVALAMAGAAVAGARAAAVHDGILVRLAGSGRTIVAGATVAEEPEPVRYGGRWAVLSVARVQTGGQTWRTRERAGVILPASAGPMAVGDHLLLSAGVERSTLADPLGGRPAVVLRRPRIASRSPSRSPLLRASDAVRAAARERALETIPPDRAGLLVGIALGDTSVLPAEIDSAFKTAGLTHLVAVSGENVGVVLAAGLGLAVALGAGRPLLAVLGIALVAWFALLTRWEPSVLRASAVAILALLGVATGRGPGGRRSLCLAAVVLLLANPALLWSLGFLLSVAATAGVLWVGPAAARVLPARLPHAARTAIGVSLGAQAGASPVLALAFGQFSVAGLAANLVAVPVAAVPMLLGVVAAGAAALHPLTPVATLACHAADPFLAALISVAEHASGLPAASVTLAGPARLLPAVATFAGVIALRRRTAALDRAAAPDRAASTRPSPWGRRG